MGRRIRSGGKLKLCLDRHSLRSWLALDIPDCFGSMVGFTVTFTSQEEPGDSVAPTALSTRGCAFFWMVVW